MGRAARSIIPVVAALLTAGLMALGVWQIERRAWKLDLIARVEARVTAAPVSLPAREDWGRLDPSDLEYTRVMLHGRFLHDAETLTLAVTERGGGFWVIAPLALDGGGTVLVNRGFITAGQRDPATRPANEDPATVTGLIRMSEPGGGFLRHNDPASDRWYSRDVAAIAGHRGLQDAAPFFVDADADANGRAARADAPVGGLTRVTFPNNHLVYALTWFALAAMTAFAGLRFRRESRRARPEQST
jgi:surfeit locus 1 family protein